MPCSAATVIGIVCEAEVAFCELALPWRLYSASNEPEPHPCSGRSANSSRPPEIERGAPAGGVAGGAAGALQAEVQAGGREQQHDACDRHERDGHIHGRARVPAIGGEHREAEQQGGDARLGEARDEPGQEPGEHGGAEQHLAPAGAPQHDRGHRQHHERKEASVDTRVEEDGVDAEVVVVLVGGHHLGVQEQCLARVLDEARRRRTGAPRRLPRRDR